MVYPTQAVVNAVVLAAYAIQSIHAMLVKLFKQCIEFQSKWQQSTRLKLTLEFENPNNSI